MTDHDPPLAALVAPEPGEAQVDPVDVLVGGPDRCRGSPRTDATIRAGDLPITGSDTEH